MTSETVVLLGAGASFPGMCSVRDLTDFLVGWADRREPSSDAPDRPSPETATIALGPSDLRAPLFAALARIVATNLEHPDALDFEQLIHVCEQLGTMFPLPPTDYAIDAFRFLLAPFLAPSALAHHFNISSLEFAAQDACYAILDEVANRCDQVSTSNHPQAVGLAELAKRTTLRAFSLNYDDLPFSSGVAFYDGWENGCFLPEYPWPRSRHTLCQLHGSILWGRHESRPFELGRFASRQEARTHRNSRGGSQQFMDRSSGSNVPMITGLRKADRILERPYGTYFHVFRDELLRCPNWLIAGYGFRDPHVNAIIAQARASWRHRGHQQRIVIVDFHNFEWADEHGVELVRVGGGVSAVLGRILKPVFGDELREFHHPITATVRSGELTAITSELAVWLNGAGPAFTTNHDAAFAWLGL